MKYFTIVLFVLFTNYLYPQYWQQTVNYDINVSLDDQKHFLHAFETIQYTNNSPQSLMFIYMHLWPNAYQKKRTALFRQLEKNKNKVYYRLNDDQFGGIDSLDFRINNEKLKWEFCSGDSIDIAKIYLTKPIATGETILITTPFRVKIPSASISRLGHSGQQYQITQWYPKPAVFDKDGWQQMPYLNQGEFYSEYGAFDVKITLPENYVVGATGDLVDGETEMKWMKTRADSSLSETFRNSLSITTNGKTNKKVELPSSPKLKTLHFHQDLVHDFAFFTSKTYLVIEDAVTLPNSKNVVKTLALFNPQYYFTWKNAAQYVAKSIYAYSKWNGDYMYKHATAVEGALSAGAGMEYPNITVLPGDGDSMNLELVVAHEVGHNWFYGMLGTNERKYAWMDEGINTSNEIRYMEENYKRSDMLQSFGIPSWLSSKFGLSDLSDKKIQNLEYVYQTRTNMAQACNSNARNYSPGNYGAIVYAKAGLSFYYLRKYLGDELYDKCMQAYFSQWKIKHPQPEDLKSVIERVCSKNLDWLFKDLLGTKEVLDYKIQSATQKENAIAINLKNRSNIAAPINIGLIKNDSLIANQWFDGFQSNSKVSFNTSIKDYDKIVIDPNENMVQPYRRNDHLKVKGLFKKLEPLQVNFLGKFEDDKHTPINFSPVFGYNDHNKLMLGLWIHNLEIPKHFEYQLMPMFAFGSQTLVGQASVFYNTLKGERWSNVKVGAIVKSYRDFYTEYTQYFYTPFTGLGINEIPISVSIPDVFSNDYLKIAPEITFEMRNRNYNKAATSYFKFRSVNIIYNPKSDIFNFKNEFENINIFSYNYTKKLLLYQEWVDPKLELSPDFGKLSASYKIHIVYNRKKTKGFTARAFGGLFLYQMFYINNFNNSNGILDGSLRNSSVFRNSSKYYSLSGVNDYLYDNTYPVRNSIGPGFIQQNWYLENDGAMKNVNGINDNYDRIFSLNLKLDIPKLPIYFYHDFAAVNNRSLKESNRINNFGVALILVRNIAEIYFPIYNNRIDFYKNNRYPKAIRFQLNFDLMNPVKILKDNL